MAGKIQEIRLLLSFGHIKISFGHKFNYVSKLEQGRQQKDGNRVRRKGLRRGSSRQRSRCIKANEEEKKEKRMGRSC